MHLLASDYGLGFIFGVAAGMLMAVRLIREERTRR
jgi:prolipoprotein diacylglyceryltransferase